MQILLSGASQLCKDQVTKPETFKFPAGETQTNLSSESILELKSTNNIYISTRLTDGDRIQELLQVCDILKYHGLTDKVTVLMAYTPYQQMDRRITEGESFTLKVFAEQLKAAGINKIVCFDLHSDTIQGMLDHVEAITNHDYIEQVVEHINDPALLLLCPDAGASKKISKLAASLASNKFSGVVKADKVRNTRTGEIEGTEVYGTDLAGKDFLIVDDICVGGRTFIEIAKKLREANCGKIYLAVSHGVFSKGTEVLKSHFDKVFTTNSYKETALGKLNQLVEVEANFLYEYKLNLLK
jgi:ribose-phosphate pyrophosphokinase